MAKLILMLLLQWLISTPAHAEDEVLVLLKELKGQVQALKGQIEQANNRISDLEGQLEQYRNQQQAAAPTADGAKSGQGRALASSGNASKASEKAAVTVGDVKGTFKIPGTDTSVGLGGFVKTDILLSSVSAGRDKAGDQQLIVSQIPVGGLLPGENSQLAFHAKESRLWFKTFAPSDWGDINTYIELDFFGDAAAYTYSPRLRHAYGSIGNLLAGHTWTTFLNSAALPDHLDSGGSAGALNSLRQTQVRWTQPFSLAGVAMDWQAAIETPRSRIWDGTSTAARNPNIDPNLDNGYFTTPNADRYPDLIARLNVSPEWGNLSLAALGRQIRFTNSATGFQRGEWGAAVNLAGKINTFGLDNIRFMTYYGNGDGRYVSNNNTFSDASLDANGNLDLTSVYGAMLSYQHWWNKQWRSNVTYGLAQAEQAGFANRVLNKQVQSLHANLLWSPVSQAVLGVEYTYATRELIDGRDGDLQRLQFSARYSF